MRYLIFLFLIGCDGQYEITAEFLQNEKGYQAELNNQLVYYSDTYYSCLPVTGGYIYLNPNIPVLNNDFSPVTCSGFLFDKESVSNSLFIDFK